MIYANGPSEKEIDGIIDFESSRRRAGGNFHHPITGLGPQGHHTLRLPANRAVTVVKFVGGVPTTVAVEPDPDPATDALFREAILAMRIDHRRNIIEADEKFLRLAAALLLRNYDLTDDDLTMLLSGKGWRLPLLEYLMRGESGVQQLAEMSTDLIFPTAPAADLIAEPDADAYERRALAPSPRRRWWQLRRR